MNLLTQGQPQSPEASFHSAGPPPASPLHLVRGTAQRREGGAGLEPSTCSRSWPPARQPMWRHEAISSYLLPARRRAWQGEAPEQPACSGPSGQPRPPTAHSLNPRGLLPSSPHCPLPTNVSSTGWRSHCPLCTLEYSHSDTLTFMSTLAHTDTPTWHTCSHTCAVQPRPSHTHPCRH